jgi:hypothetical protein
MDDIAVVTSLMIRNNRLLFDDQNFQISIFCFQLQGCGQTYRATSHNNYVVLHRQVFFVKLVIKTHRSMYYAASSAPDAFIIFILGIKTTNSQPHSAV